MMSRILNHEQNTEKYAHLTKQGEARKSGQTAVGRPRLAEAHS